MLRKAHHRNSLAVAYRTGGHHKVKSFSNLLCVLAVGFIKIPNLIQYKAVGVFGFYSKIPSVRFSYTVINRQGVRLTLPSHSVEFCLMFRFKLLNILVDFENVFGGEPGIVAVHLIVVFRFHKERRVDVSQKLIRHFFKVGNKPIRVFGMIRNIILLDEFLENREAQIT